MKEIPLTKGYKTIVDDEDYDFLMQWTWFILDDKPGSLYACRRERMSEGGQRNKLVFMHKVVGNIPDDKQGDHKDRNTLNNRKLNIREATWLQNQYNKKHDSITGFKGVGVSSSKKNPYRSSIKLHNKIIHLGMFACPIEAAKAYNAAATEAYGEFAYLNEV